MALSDPIATRRAGTKLLRNYVDRVGSWAGSVARQYMLGVGILVVGGLFVLVAAGFGGAAIFHFLALRYGINVAFAIVGGFFLVLGLVGFLFGLGRLKSASPPMPRPFGELDALKRTAALDLLTKTDQVKQLAKDHSTSMLLAQSA